MSRIELHRTQIGKFELAKLTAFPHDLPRELDDYRIVQLSDFHFGSVTSRAHIEAAISAANQLNPHLILMTGDYVQSTHHGDRYPVATRIFGNLPKRLKHRRSARQMCFEFSDALKALCPPDGIYAILGNHDYSESSNYLVRQTSTQVTWLTNQSAIISKSNFNLQICGIDDLWRGSPNPAAAFNSIAYINNLPANSSLTPFKTDATYRIAVSHNPDIFCSENWTYPSDLALAGHTHGGQIRIPLWGAVFTRTDHRKLARGLTQLPGVNLFVSSGIGYGLAPIRVFCPPEITLITLKCS